MAGYFDELHVEEDELDRLRETYLRNLSDRQAALMSRFRDIARAIEISNRDIAELDTQIINLQNTRPPASKSEIEKLKTPPFEDLIDEQCRICLSQYQLNDKALNMPCKHIFHENCLKTWLEKSNFCPLCKFELKTDNEIDIETVNIETENENDTETVNIETENDTETVNIETENDTETVNNGTEKENESTNDAIKRTKRGRVIKTPKRYL